MKSSYNYIYKELVNDEDDMVGMIAYCFYKQQKIEYIEQFEIKNNRHPTDEDLSAFHQISNSPSQLKNYRENAFRVAKNYSANVLTEKTKELDDFYANRARDEIRSTKPNFMFGVYQGIVASLFFSIIIGTLAFVSWSSRIGIKDAIGETLNLEIKEKSSSSAEKKTADSK